MPVSRLDDAAVLRQVLEQMSLKLDGTQAAAKTVNRDKRVVINPQQAAKLLAAVWGQAVPGQPRRSAGPMLAMYYAALRPEEAARCASRTCNSGRGEVRPVPSSPPLTVILHEHLAASERQETVGSSAA
jgi:hypothetical protein